MTIYPLTAVRSLALHASGLDTPNGHEPAATLDSVFSILDQLGAIQIDTLQMVARAHYVTLWSRLGAYDQTLFDHLANDPQERRMYEGWFHAVCFLPIGEYRYQLPLQRYLRQNGHHWYTDWIQKPGNPELVAGVLERVRQEGALRASNLEGETLREKFATWWNWRPEKLALEHLYDFGDLMIAGRVNFQRIYDLTERVLPVWVDTTEPDEEERDRFWLERGARALGIGLLRHVAEYSKRKMGAARPLINKLITEGTLVEVQGETMTGVQTLIVHRDNLLLLEKAVAGEIFPGRTTFLNPFDNLWWGIGRDELFWGFRQRLEAYYPAQKRIYGYFCLPILYKDKLVGRFDPKLERKTGLLRIKALYLEPGIESDEQMLVDIAKTMQDFLRFHKATDLMIEKSDPTWFGEKLLRVV